MTVNTFYTLYDSHVVTLCVHISHVVITVGLERTLYQVSEDVGAVNVCAIINFYSSNVDCPVPFSFDINLLTGDGSAGE